MKFDIIRPFQPARWILIIGMAIVSGPSLGQEAQHPSSDWRERVYAATRNQNWSEALKIVNESLIQAPEDYQLLHMRARLLDRSGDFNGAVNDLDRLIQQRSGDENLYQLRGDAKLKAGKFEQAIQDFDAVVKLRPERDPYSWQRGIAYYYARKYEEGRRQFERHQTVNSNDVENAVWHYLCVLRGEGLGEARRRLIPISGDPRTPMQEVHALFAGKGTVDSVLEAASEPTPNESEKANASFYAHLYLALYFDAMDQSGKAREHIRLAAKNYRDFGYMGAIAKVHLDYLENSRNE
jgi:lipoprotein NlpI